MTTEEILEKMLEAIYTLKEENPDLNIEKTTEYLHREIGYARNERIYGDDE